VSFFFALEREREKDAWKREIGIGTGKDQFSRNGKTFLNPGTGIVKTIFPFPVMPRDNSNHFSPCEERVLC